MGCMNENIYLITQNVTPTTVIRYFREIVEITCQKHPSNFSTNLWKALWNSQFHTQVNCILLNPWSHQVILKMKPVYCKEFHFLLADIGNILKNTVARWAEGRKASKRYSLSLSQWAVFAPEVTRLKKMKRENMHWRLRGGRNCYYQREN